MKKAFNLFLLFCRYSAGKLLLLTLVGGLVQAGLFLWRAPEPSGCGLTDTLSACQYPLTLAIQVTLTVLLVVLTTVETGEGKHCTSYFLHRLSLSPTCILLCQAVFNWLALVLFWALEGLILLGICLLYGKLGGLIGPQTLFVACWNPNLPLHNFLPLEDTSLWIGNLLSLAGTGLLSACCTYHLRKKEGSAGTGVLAVSVPILLLNITHGKPILAVVLFLISFGLLYAIRTEEKEGDHAAASE